MFEPNDDATLTVTCDECPNWLALDSMDYSSASYEMKQMGWWIIPDGTEFRHLCSSCKEDLDEE